MTPESPSLPLKHERPSIEDVERRLATQATTNTVVLDTVASPKATLFDLHREHPEIEEREYQLDCLTSLAQAHENSVASGIVHMATGLGKTTIAATDVKRFLDAKPTGRILFLCHRLEILEQAKERFEHILGPNYMTGTYTGAEKSSQEASCVFASFQAIGKTLEDFEADEFDYVIVDECHHAQAKSYKRVIKHFTPEFLLGLTATPHRKDLKNIRDIFEEEIYSKSLAEALSEHLLAYPNYWVITDKIDEGALDLEDASIAELNKTLFVPRRDEEIAKIIYEKVAEKRIENPRIIGFCASIEHAERMAALLPGAETVHSKLTDPARKKQLMEGFRSGDISTLMTVDMFNEGIDIPEANVLVFLRSTESETIFLQQLGRGLRKTSQKSEVLVLDFVANCDRLIMIEKLIHTVFSRRYANVGRPGQENDDNEYSDEDIYGLDFDDVKKEAAEVQEIHLGSFNFTETTRKIIDLIKRVQGEDAPEGYISVGSFSKQTGLSRDFVLSVMSKEGWATKSYKFRGKMAEALTESQARHILATPAAMAPPLPENYHTVPSLAEELDMSPATLRKLMEKHGYNPPVFKHYSIRTQGISPEMSVQIKERVGTRAEVSPDDWYSLNTAAAEVGIARQTLKKVIADLGIKMEKRRFGPAEAPAINPEQLELIRQHPLTQVQPAPKDWESIHQFAKRHEVTDVRMFKIIKGLGIATTQYKFGPMVSEALSTSQQKDLADYLSETIGPKAGEDIVTTSQAASDFGLTVEELNQTMFELSISPRKYQFNRTSRDGLDKAQVKLLAEYFNQEL